MRSINNSQRVLTIKFSERNVIGKNFEPWLQQTFHFWILIVVMNLSNRCDYVEPLVEVQTMINRINENYLGVSLQGWQYNEWADAVEKQAKAERRRGRATKPVLSGHVIISDNDPSHKTKGQHQKRICEVMC